MKYKSDWIFATLVLAVIVLGGYWLVWSIKDGTNRSEIAECQKWQEYAAMYDGFYVVQWQADQCEAHSIQINAPIK